MAPGLGHRLRSERAFERLYRRHVGDVYRYSLALLRNPDDAEDVTQTTFLNAYRAFRRGDRPDAPRAWLIAIAHNVCRQRFRTAGRRVDEVALEETALEAASADPDTPTADEIRRALAHLGFNQRAALVMRELEGRSYAEIATALDLSASAVETLLFRARRALREQLEGALTCREAELAISRQLDRRLPRGERAALRAHLRSCGECASLARRQRAQRSAIRSLALVPLPSSLASWMGGGATAGSAAAVAGGGGLVAKAAAVAAVGTVAVGVGGTVALRETAPATKAPVKAPATARATPVAAAAPARRTVPVVAFGARSAVTPAGADGNAKAAGLGRTDERVKAPPGRARGQARSAERRAEPEPVALVVARGRSATRKQTKARHEPRGPLARTQKPGSRGPASKAQSVKPPKARSPQPKPRTSVRRPVPRSSPAKPPAQGNGGANGGGNGGGNGKRGG